jgi:formylglycine-generating enzyme required for sulfatase activity
MLDKRLKWAFFIALVVFAGFPIGGIILDVLKPGSVQVGDSDDTVKPGALPMAPPQPIREDMVLIPDGEFVRGYNGGGFDEKPEGRVMLDAYRIDRDEVTFASYMAFVEATRHRKPISRYVKHFEKLSGPNQPAVYVSWDDADVYCRYRGARLPTEAEWEKAARGPDGWLWPWGNQDRRGAANTGNPDPFEFTAPVASFPQDRSPYGVFDMEGNAMEWVADWYQEDSYKPNARNPKGPDNGLYKVIRGASWGTVGQETRLTIRLKMVPDFRDTTIGFRCAKAAMAGSKPEAAKTTQLYNKSK